MENPAFIGSIIDVLVGIVNIYGGFYQNFDKINQNHHTGVKIPKLGREIIKISIISPVQSHKLFNCKEYIEILIHSLKSVY